MAAALSLVVQHVGLGSCPGCPARAHPVANNPFRMFPGNVMATIRAMTTVTPSAAAIRDADLSFRRRKDGGLEVQGRAYFIVATTGISAGGFIIPASKVQLGMRVGTYVTNRLLFWPRRDTRQNPELGVVRTRKWIVLRKRYSFEDALHYIQTMVNDWPWYEPEEIDTEESNMYEGDAAADEYYWDSDAVIDSPR